jgi:predicted aldo/keto reductase-like oxidoreductase
MQFGTPRRTAVIAPGLQQVCRLGLASRGGCGLAPEDVDWAIERGVNYLNWCGHADGLSEAVKRLGSRRRNVVVAVQFQSRTSREAAIEFRWLLDTLRTDYIDIATLYYVESAEEWSAITSRGGAWEWLDEQKRAGRLGLIGLTSHQRKLAASWAQSGLLDMLMIRYNAAHRGAENDIFPVTAKRKMPVVSFTGLRWKALLETTPEDPLDFVPPTAADCYRFCLASEDITVVLTAPGNRKELEDNLTLLDDWRAPSPMEIGTMRAHGDRVRRRAGTFW